MCTAANIPLNKSDHPAVRQFLTTRVKSGGAIPGTHQLQEAYLLDHFDHEKKKLKDFLRDKKLAIIFDEMSDDEGRFVLNILAAPLARNEDGQVLTYLLGAEFLAVTNHMTVSKAVIKVINDFYISCENIVVFDTGDAAYMKKAYTQVLSGLFPNSIHVTCLAHILNLVGESFRKPFTELNAFVRSFSQMFFMAGARKGRYLAHIKQNLPTVHPGDKPPRMAPDLVQTRWNSWYFAVQYHKEHFDAYKTFIDAEKEVCKDPPQSVENLYETLSDPQQVMMLWSHIKFVADMCEPILTAMGQFESQKPCTVQAFDRLEELLISFEANAITSQVMDRYHENCDDLSLQTRSTNLALFTTAFEAAADKLHKYVSAAGDGQPAIQFLKAVRIMDPSRVCVVSHNIADYEVIPGFSKISQSEFDLYVEKLAPEAVSVAGGLWSSETHVEFFWNSMGKDCRS